MSDTLNQSNQLIISRISQLSRLSAKALEQKLQPQGISLQEFRIVGLLLGDDKTTQKELAEKLSVRPATLSVAISKLEARGVVERLPSASDARVNLLRLTKQGNHAEALEILSSLEQQITAGIDAQELKVADKVLARVLDNLLKLPQ